MGEADFRGLSPTAGGRVARVQSILARTYALANRGRHADEGFDLCSTTHCQVYNPRGAADSPVFALVAEATRATAAWSSPTRTGRSMPSTNANCGGHTSDAAVPWGGDTPPYLTGVNDSFCALADPAEWQFEIELVAFEAALATNSLTRVDDLHTIEVASYDPAGRAVTVSIEGQERRLVSGAKLRAVLAAQFGARSFASTLFTVRTPTAWYGLRGGALGMGLDCASGVRWLAPSGDTPSTRSPPLLPRHHRATLILEA